MKLAALAAALLVLWVLLVWHLATPVAVGPVGEAGSAAVTPGVIAPEASRPTPLWGREAPRASRSRHTTAPSSRWAATAKARTVAFCESSGDITAVSRTGKYRGKWQADADFWRTYGGLQFASRPELASEAEQDAVAYRGWLARGWQPWACA